MIGKTFKAAIGWMAASNIVNSVKATGTIGVISVFEPKYPGGPTPENKQGEITFDMGTFFSKGQSM